MSIFHKLLHQLFHIKIPLSFSSLKILVFSLISILWAGIFFSEYNFSENSFYWRDAVKETGDIAWKLLLFTIFISLLQKIFPKIKIFSQLLPLRKITGIFAFLIAFSHIIAMLFQWEAFSFPLQETIPFIREDISMVFGSISFLAMLPAFITSTQWAIKKMGAKFWKNIQRLTHISFVFAVLHIAFLRYHYQNEIDFLSLVPLLVYAGGYAYLFFIQKK